MRIIMELLDFKPEHRNTNIPEALRYFTNAIKKRSTAFLLTDFLQSGQMENKQLYDSLSLTNKKHDLVALRIEDKGEMMLPKIGLIQIEDPETGEKRWIDSSSTKTRESYTQWWSERSLWLHETLTKSGVDYVRLATDEDYVQPLIKLFQKRGHRS